MHVEKLFINVQNFFSSLRCGNCGKKPVKFSTSVFLDFQGFPGVFHKFFLYCYSLLKNNLSFFLKETEELS